MPTVIVTGANRGIGFEFARQYAAQGWRVHAACRDPAAATALKEVAGDVKIHRLEVTAPEQVRSLAAALAGEPIDLLVNNAGIAAHAKTSLGDMDYALWEELLRVNVLGPMRVAEAL